MAPNKKSEDHKIFSNLYYWGINVCSACHCSSKPIMYTHHYIWLMTSVCFFPFALPMSAWRMLSFLWSVFHLESLLVQLTEHLASAFFESICGRHKNVCVHSFDGRKRADMWNLGLISMNVWVWIAGSVLPLSLSLSLSLCLSLVELLPVKRLSGGPHALCSLCHQG